MSRRPRDPSRLLCRVAIAGAGRAGGALAAALADSGVADVRLWGRDRSRARTTARRSGARLATDVPALLEGADLLVVAVRDEALEAVARRLARGWPQAAGPTAALHLAGAHPSERLGALRERGIPAGVFHPVVSLDGPRSRDAFRGRTATISGDPLARRVARALARRLGMDVVAVDDRERPLVHLAAVMAAGDTTALLGGATELLVASGIARPRARRLLASLARSALDGFERSGPARAMTGPVPRADVATLAAHLEGLARSHLPGATRRLVEEAHRALVRLGASQLAASGRLDAAARRRVTRSVEKPRA